MTATQVAVPLTNLAATLADLSTTRHLNAWVVGTDTAHANVELVDPADPGQQDRVRWWATTTNCATCNTTTDIGALAAHINQTHGRGIAYLVDTAAAWEPAP